MFYILLLELADSEILIQNKSLKLLSENEYEIEEITDYNVFTNQYLIKWKNYDQKENIWKIQNNLAKEILRILK